MADPADRAQAVETIKQRLLEVTKGHTEQEAQEVAETLVDDAIAKREGGNGASGD